MVGGVGEHFNAIKGYSKILLKLIHPDRHHGFDRVQKLNASATAKVHDLFKFAEQGSTLRNFTYLLNFYIWKTNGIEHEKICHNLVMNFPMDRVSVKSALELFLKARIPVDHSILDYFQFDTRSSSSQESQSFSNFRKFQLDNIQSELDTDVSNCEEEIKQVVNFLRIRPYIQFDGILPEKLSDVIRIGTYLSHILVRIETEIMKKEPIIIIISQNFYMPEIHNSVIKLPLNTRFEGI